MVKMREMRQWPCAAVMLALFVLLPGVPGRAIGQENPAGAAAQTVELDEAARLDQQILKLYREGKYDDAIPLAERALAIREKTLGAEHPDVAIALNGLASLYR